MNKRILHTMLRVSNLEKSIEFYTKVMGMKLLRQNENEEYRYTLVFLGYGEESESAVIELTYNWDTDSYDLGNAYGHIAIGADDIYETCKIIKDSGGDVVREAGPVLGGTTHIAFIKDPDGYMVELIQNDQATAGLEG